MSNCRRCACCGTVLPKVGYIIQLYSPILESWFDINSDPILHDPHPPTALLRAKEIKEEWEALGMPGTKFQIVERTIIDKVVG